MSENAERRAKPGFGFNDLLLGAVGLMMLTLIMLILVLYVIPPEHLEVPHLQRGVRVSRESDFPVGASRLVSWGERTVLVIRSEEDRYAALQATSPKEGCILRWDQESLRIVSPSGYAVFDLQGNVVTGLTSVSLQRYAVFLRNGVIYVGEES